MAQKSSLNISHKKETLAEFAQRYKILASPEVVHIAMKRFTQRMDLILKNRLESLSTHPKDTGLMKQSWELPDMYLRTHTGNSWNVYLINTATVGEQAKLKEMMSSVKHRKKKRTGRHNRKRYMPFVDEQTQFYTKQLRVLRNKVDSEFREFIFEFLGMAYQKGFISEQEMKTARGEFGRERGL